MRTGSTGLTGIEKRLWWRITILAVLLLAAALRWMQPGLVEFKYDEVNITRQALGLLSGGRLPVLSGGTTLGIQRGALDVYLLALPLTLIGRTSRRRSGGWPRWVWSRWRSPMCWAGAWAGPPSACWRRSLWPPTRG